MKVLLIDNYDSFTYNLAQLLAQSGLCAYDVVLNDQLSLDQVKDYDKILISPGPGLPKEAGIICEVIRTCAETKSILGICLGHQAVAEVFGGRLFQMKSAQHGQMVETEIVDNAEYLFAGIPKQFTATLYHSWTVDPESIPQDLRITAIARDQHIMGLTHRRYDVKGLQFHPESFGTDYGHTMVLNWLKGDPQSIRPGS